MIPPIHELIHLPESKTLEFKRDLSSPSPLLKTLVSFANTAGGCLVIGINDDRTVVGVDKPLDEEERLANLIADSIAPRLVPNIEMTTIEGKTLLIVEVFLSGIRPHHLKSVGVVKGVYVRLGSTNRQADPQLVSELQRGVAGIAYDALPMPDLTLDDLDIKAAQQLFGDKRRLDEKTLLTLKIITKEQGRLIPTQGGLLLFGKQRGAYFPDAWVQCGRFMGDSKTDIFDHIELNDPLPLMLDSSMLFLKKHAMRGADFSEIRRKDIWSIPLNILREVIINALVHSDYSHSGAPIRIAFYDNRIEVESPGILLPGMTVEDMKRGVSQIRNPVIARVFRELNMIEQWGSGIPGIFHEIEEQKLPQPDIEELGMRLRFTIYLAELLPLTPEQSRKVPKNLASPEGPQSGAQSRAQSRAQSEKIRFALSDAPLSATELTNLLSLETKTGAFKRAIKELLDAGVIEYTLPEKPTSRLQKYRLVKK